MQKGFEYKDNRGDHCTKEHKCSKRRHYYLITFRTLFLFLNRAIEYDIYPNIGAVQAVRTMDYYILFKGLLHTVGRTADD